MVPRKQEEALRYLLLRFLWTARGLVSNEVYNEVATSMKVYGTDDGFTVRWFRGGLEFNKTFKKDAFRFYARGDNFEAHESPVNVRRHNSLGAMRFVCEALECDEFNNTMGIEPLFTNKIISLCGWTACCTLMWIVGGNKLILFGALTLAMFTSELWYEKGKLFVPFLLILLFVIDFPYTAIVSAILYSISQLLDPDKQFRKLRIYLSLAVFVFGSLQTLWYGIVPNYGLSLTLVVGLAMVIFFFRWTAGSHFQSFPLIFPFFCIGVYLDGQFLPSVIGLGCAIVDAFLSHIGFRLVPVQKEKSLSANG